MDRLPTSTKPRFKKISPYEVYLLDENGRTKRRICGTQKNNEPEGYVCTHDAGLSTSHPGTGQCSFHDRQITNGRNTGLWERLNKASNLPSNLIEYFQNVEIIEEEHLLNVDDDIRLLYVLQSYVLNRRRDTKNEGEGYLTSQDIELLMKITDKVLKAKDVRVKLKKELVLDTSTVKSFVEQIFKIILTEASKPMARRIMQGILSEVILPFRTQGRIRGGEFSFDGEVGEIAEEISDAEVRETSKTD